MKRYEAMYTQYRYVRQTKMPANMRYVPIRPSYNLPNIPHSYTVCMYVQCRYVCIIIYRLIPTATITFSKQKCTATKLGQLVNLCRKPSSSIYSSIWY